MSPNVQQQYRRAWDFMTPEHERGPAWDYSKPTNPYFSLDRDQSPEALNGFQRHLDPKYLNMSAGQTEQGKAKPSEDYASTAKILPSKGKSLQDNQPQTSTISIVKPIPGTNGHYARASELHCTRYEPGQRLNDGGADRQAESSPTERAMAILDPGYRL